MKRPSLRTRAWVASLIIGVLAASCNTRARESTSSSTTTTGTVGTLGQNTSDSATAGATGQPGSSATGAAPSEQRTMNDATILAALAAANDGDIASGRLAQSKGGSAAVRAFAHTMVADHSAAKAKGDQVAAHAGITPQSSDAVARLERQAATTRDSLQLLTGADFDRAYVAGEIAMHEQVLDMIDRMMIPGAQSADVRSLLEQVRPVIAGHLEHARSLGTQLAAGQ
jgi:putative membrane protein